VEGQKGVGGWHIILSNLEGRNDGGSWLGTYRMGAAKREHPKKAEA